MNKFLMLGSIDSVSSNDVPTFAEDYMINAWNNFKNLTSWMADTTILTVNGINITFMGLLVSVAVFTLICEFVNKFFWGD